MKKHVSTISISFLLCVVLLLTTMTHTHAQTPNNTGVVTLANLGKAEISLNGPYDTSTTSFGLPAYWKLIGDSRIDLNITTAINSAAQSDILQALGGTLTVSFNRVTVGTFVLNKVGTYDYAINIPAALLVSLRTDGLMELKFMLDSGISCVANQRMSVVVNASSRMTFPYEEQQPDTSLIKFPRPLVQASIFPDLALLVIPDKPTALELQSAFTIAAGLGNLSSDKLTLDLVSLSQLTDQQKAASHLIFVGKAASIPTLAELTLPLKIKNQNFVLPEDSQDNGVIQMVNSPWSIRNVVLVVGGNTDLGTLKAAQAVSTGIFQQNTSPNLALVQDIQNTALPAPLLSDQTFADMGYTEQEFSNRGVDYQSYNFYIPFGSVLNTDAYLELAFGHSALLNYNISGLVVLLNGQPIGSVRFTDVSAAQAINRVRFFIPPSVAIPGDNRIEIRASLEPLDNCSDPNLGGLWTVIWADSRLHLPFSSLQLNTQMTLDLSAYPAPMTFDSTLETTAIIVQHSAPEYWRAFLPVASYLGNQSNGAITKLAVFFDDEISDVDLSPYNLIVVGQPSKLGVMNKLNSLLPVPFVAGSDNTEGKFLQVTYQIPPEVPVGYVELMPSPWNKEKVLIAALGNSATGVNWGISSLVDAPLRSQLAGDFAVINDFRIQTVDTRLVVPVENTSVPQLPSEMLTPSPLSQPSGASPSGSRPAWLLPALILTIVLVVLVIFAVVFLTLRSWRKK